MRFQSTMKPMEKALSIVILGIISFCFLCRRGDALQNFLAFLPAAGIARYAVDIKQKQIVAAATAGILLIGTWFLGYLDYLLLCMDAFIMIGYFLYEKSRAQGATTSPAPTTPGLVPLTSWSDYNHLLPFQMEKYSYEVNEFFSIKRGIITQNNTYFAVDRFVIQEERSILQLLLGLSTIRFISRFGDENCGKDEYIVENIRCEEAENLLRILKMTVVMGRG